MIKRLICILLVCFPAGCALAQTMEQKVFALVCSDITKQELYAGVQAKVRGVFIIGDPATGERHLQYPTHPDENTKKLLQYSKAEQLQIVSTVPLPIIPLGDTVIIADTTGFFAEGIMLHTNHYFATSRCANNQCYSKVNTSVFFLKAMSKRGNQLKLAFSFKNITRSYVCNINTAGHVTFVSSAVVNQRVGFENE